MIKKEASVSYSVQEDKEIYMAELNDKDLIIQLKMKQECVENEKKINKKFRVKDERLADLKDKLLAKQIVLDDLISTRKSIQRNMIIGSRRTRNKQGRFHAALQEEILLNIMIYIAIYI